MSMLSSIAVTFGRITTLLQVILYLPLTLDVAGQDAFLALSASLAVYYALLSTLRIATKRTQLAWFGDLVAVFQFVVVPACLLIVFNVYSPPSESYFNRKTSELNANMTATSSTLRPGFFSSRLSDATNTTTSTIDSLSTEPYLGDTAQMILQRLVSITYFLARNVPPWWHMFLRYSSPVFSLLEGIATLLVIQVVGSFSRWLIARSLSRRPPTPRLSYFSWIPALLSSLTSAEFLQLFFLLIAALIYVFSALALYVSFEGATRDRPGTAAATGVAVSSALWLTAIAFAVRRGNVVETSLMFAYVVWNVYQLSDSLSFGSDPLSLIRSFKVLDKSTGSTLMSLSPLLDQLPPVIVALVHLLSNALGQSARFIAAATAALPKSVIVSLIYRLMVLYSASRILPLLKRGGGPKGWEGDGSSWGSASNTSSSSSSDDSSVFTESESEDEAEKDKRKRSPKKGKDNTKGWQSHQLNVKADSKGKARVPTEEERQRAKRRKREELRLREEEPFGAFISLIVSYSRLILIAVYSHLLLLDQSHMVYWRFLTVGITLFVWALELILGKDENPDAALW
ncbi:hypothetical protein CBS101457_001253 [Exobasidium rhododendri]|nr:hypothetical protein CBS101457_001253 [Exobasidium rhododendri]